MHKLSVITINYNNAIGLQQTIESLLGQSWKQFELIIIDGGSEDGSLEIIKKHSESVTHFVTENDNGIYHAMNKGIRKATGEYCFFLNSGDYLADKMIFEKVFETNPNEDILFGNLYVELGGKIIGKAFGKELLAFSDIYANTIKHQSSFIKRSLFDRFGFYNENRKIVADWEFFIKTIGLGNVSYCYIDEFICFFDNNGISNRSVEITKKEREQVISENIPLMMQPDYEFLARYGLYTGLFKNRFSFFLLRILRKILLIKD